MTTSNINGADIVKNTLGEIRVLCLDATLTTDKKPINKKPTIIILKIELSTE